MASVQNKGLGKGLSALMADDYSQDEFSKLGIGDSVATLPITDLISGKFQPRKEFDAVALGELAESIKSNGVMQPILVRKIEERNGANYEIIAGERRWRASKLAGLTDVPVLIKDIEDKKALEMALIENVQRQDLNALEEALGYQQLIDNFGYTQEELSSVVGKSRSHIANFLRLLALPIDVKDFLSRGEISAGHARALLKADDAGTLVHEIVRRGLNVRQTENLCKNGGYPESDKDGQADDDINFVETKISPKNSVTEKSSVRDVPKDPDIVAIEEALSEHLAMKVDIDDFGEKGAFTIHYESLAQLDVILKKLGGI